MTMLFMDGFDHYGIDDDHLLDGVYADKPTTTIGAPTFGARTGEYSISFSFGSGMRKVLPTSGPAIITGMGYGVEALPANQNKTTIFYWRDGSNVNLYSLRLQTTGDVELWSFLAADGGSTGNPVRVVGTQAPVIVAGNWHFLEFGVDTDASTFRLDVDGTTVINATGIAGMIGQAVVQIAFGGRDSGVSPGQIQWFDDLTIKNTDGTHNNSFDGDVRVAALYAQADGDLQGWTPQYRHKLGTGILANNLSGNLSLSPSCISSPNSTSLDLGTADFTLEGFFRWNVLPTGGNKSHIFGKWDETNNRRSYQLYLGGPTLENGNIVFRTSTNGAAGTVVENISFPWPGGAPDLNTWYHIALVRASDELLLFINGTQYGLPISDTSTYFAGVAPFSVGAQVEGTSSVIANTGLNGWVDEVRITPGVARYTSNFTPTTVPFPRSAPDDPDFASVALLSGFDSGINDESSYARTVTGRNSAAAVTPDDGFFAFQSIYHHAPQDDTFIEAALLPAGSTLTLDAQPDPADTVTVGTYTDSGSQPAVYKFVAALVDPFDVLIGASVPATLQNLINAINKSAGEGTTYGTGTIVNDDVVASGLPGDQLLVTAIIAGVAGNSIASTSSLSNGGGWTDTTLVGGADIPGPSEFFFDRPPINTTVIRAVQIINRSFKSDSGTGKVQASFVGPLGAVDTGAETALTVTPTYRWDIFEEDPDTNASITPSTIVGGRVRIDRTE